MVKKMKQWIEIATQLNTTFGKQVSRSAQHFVLLVFLFFLLFFFGFLSRSFFVFVALVILELAL